MLRPRLIPCLLLQNNGLVKTTNFTEPKYVGDPINAVRIFNEKSADELLALDITATTKGNEPNYNLIANIANECRMPLCYGGGIKSADQVERIISLGVEKVALASVASDKPEIVTSAATRVGSQSIACVIDIKKTGFRQKYQVTTHNGTKVTGQDPIKLAKLLQDNGAGEIILNSVDLDGKMCGYDLELISKVRDVVHIPMTVLGGAGNFDDISSLWKRFGLIGAGVGSLFVFKGKFRAVLINYPEASEKESLLAKSGWKQ